MNDFTLDVGLGGTRVLRLGRIPTLAAGDGYAVYIFDTDRADDDPVVVGMAASLPDALRIFDRTLRARLLLSPPGSA